MAPGDAVVTGFSGAPPPAQLAAGVNPSDATFIDPTGPAVQVFNLQTPGAPPLAQVIPAPSLYTATAAQVGQVFGVALDDATPPNIYVAASSVYGLPIVAPGEGGQLARLHQGAAGASFMPGLFGPAAQGGGPGSIWRINGKNGAVSLFANVKLNGVANAGPALGGLVFDAASKTLLVSDRETGMVHRFNLSGAEVGRFDHGTQGRPNAGLPAVAFDPSQAVAITDPHFNSDNPASWGYAAPERRVFGLGVQSGRLYYGVAAGLQVWSVGLDAGGAFGADARIEVQVPPAPGATEISKIVFDGSGDMVLAERAAPTGDYALSAVAEPGIARVLGYAPATGAQSAWESAPVQYAIGFPGQMHNANGGVAIGYGYDQNGNLNAASCDGSVWSTGEQMRNSAEAALAGALASNGTLYLNGIQGNAIDLVEPADVPPTSTYFIDYRAQLDGPALRGRMGDIAIPTICGQSALPAPSPSPSPQAAPPPLPPPPLPPLPSRGAGGACAPGYVTLPNGGCCLAGQATSNGACCPAGQRPDANGKCQSIGRCPPGEVMDPRNNTCGPPPACAPGMTRNAAGTCTCPEGQTIQGGTVKCVAFCPQGEVRDASGACVRQEPTCPAGQVPSRLTRRCEQTCAPGQVLGTNGVCATPPTLTCALGERAVDGKCYPVLCPPGQAVTGVGSCVPSGACPAGQARNERGACASACPAGEVRDLAGDCRTGIIAPSNPTPCPAGQELDSAGKCVAPAGCPAGEVKGPFGACIPQQKTCPAGQFLTSAGFCAAQCSGGFTPNPTTGDCAPPPACPQGQTRNTDGQCVATGTAPPCPSGQVRSALGQCVADAHCPKGEAPNVNDVCVDVSITCPSGQQKTASGTCVPAGPCPSGEYRVTATGLCAAACPSGYIATQYGGCTQGQCPFGRTRNADGICAVSCPPGQTRNDAGNCVVPTPCPKGDTRDASGDCVKPAAPAPPGPLPPCQTGETRNASGDCVKGAAPTPPPPCPSGETRNASGVCVATKLPSCPSGETRNAAGDCVATAPPPCPSGETRNASGACARTPAIPPSPCPNGETRNASGTCVGQIPCPKGQSRNASGACVENSGSNNGATNNNQGEPVHKKPAGGGQ